MKTYIEDCINSYTKEASEVLSHMFCTLGNGVSLNTKGYIRSNWESTEVYDFKEPTALTSIYPWSDSKEFQPFRKFAGCRDVGFKESVLYFIACLETTPYSVENIAMWKRKIPLMKKVLLDTPTIEDEYTGKYDMQSFLSKLDKSKPTSKTPRDGAVVTNSSVYKVWYFDVQWGDCPTFVETEVRDIWSSRGLGNDNFIYSTVLNTELFDRYPNIYFWLKHKGVVEEEDVIIHWWW